MYNATNRVLLALVSGLIAATAASAQNDDDNWPAISYLRSDYRQVSAVARVNVRTAEIVNRIGGYEDWHLVGDVIEPFKGKFRKGDPIDFYHGAEKASAANCSSARRLSFWNVITLRRKNAGCGQCLRTQHSP